MITNLFQRLPPLSDLENMEDWVVHRDTVTICTVINECAKAGKIDDALAIWGVGRAVIQEPKGTWNRENQCLNS